LTIEQAKKLAAKCKRWRQVRRILNKGILVGQTPFPKEHRNVPDSALAVGYALEALKKEANDAAL